MRALGAAVLALACSSPAAAQEYPALFDVTGVAPQDVLNIRTRPDAGSAIVGSLAADQKQVEGVARDKTGKWVQVNTGETAGWASRRYLAPVPADPEFPLQRSFTCFGTEPFWSLAVTQDSGAVFSTPDAEETVTAGRLQAGAGRTDRYLLPMQGGQAAVIRRETCSDGMSDRVFGLSADLLLNRSGPVLFSGCCSLAP